ncbi:MAG: DUF302 domain-containing protein [Betaproteobacteria bacterium]|nr:DUF302 domain-containing protein [Betaproteobacteria bacterium]
MSKFLLALTYAFLLAQGAWAEVPQVIEVRSTHTVVQTLWHLEHAIHRRHLHIVAMVDHSGAAHKVGLDLPPTKLVIFGNPALGTKLMQMNQQAGLGLPLKMLVWEDAEHRVWLGYTDPAVFARRYDISPSAEPILLMTKALHAIAAEAAGE